VHGRLFLAMACPQPIGVSASIDLFTDAERAMMR
jgi:hypothetical protein